MSLQLKNELDNEQKLRDHRVGHEIINRGSDEDDAILEQARIDVERTLATAVLFDDDRDIVVIAGGG